MSVTITELKRIFALDAAGTVDGSESLALDRVDWALPRRMLLSAIPTGLAGKTLYVDSVNGSDVTGTRGYSSKPFLTLAAARTAAQSGDLIVVGPGSYTAQRLEKTGTLHWYYQPGAVVTNVSDDIYRGLVGTTLRVYGHGEFNAADGTVVLLPNHSGADTIFEAAKMTATTLVAVDHQNGTTVIRCPDIRSDSDSGSVVHAGGTLTLDNCQIRSSTGSGIDISGSGLTLLNCLIISPSGNSSLNGSGVTVVNRGSASNRAKSAGVTVNGQAMVESTAFV